MNDYYLLTRRLLTVDIEFTENISTNNSIEFDPDFLGPEIVCAPFFTYLKILHMYYIPIIIAVGVLGNFLSGLVFLTTHLKLRSSSYYLAALSIADFGFLCVVFVVHCSFNNIFDIFHKNGWCQFFVYVSSVCATLSVWLVVAFTVERFIAVQYPLQRPHICTVSRAKIIVISLTMIVMTSHLYVFKVAGLINLKDRQECDMLPDYYELMEIVNFIDTLATLILPFLLIVSLNTMIVYNLFLFRKRVQAGSLDECLYMDEEKTELQKFNLQTGRLKQQSDSQQSHSSLKLNPSRFFKNRCQIDLPCIQIRMSALNVISIRNQQSITKMLLLTSSVFLALNFPSYVIRVSVYFAFTLQEKTPPAVLWCVQQFVMLLYYTNFSINFLLYSMCGVTFRRCLWKLIRNKCKQLCRKSF